MNVCVNCSRVNPDDAEECLECGGSKFEPLLVACYENGELWKYAWIKEKGQ